MYPIDGLLVPVKFKHYFIINAYFDFMLSGLCLVLSQKYVTPRGLRPNAWGLIAQSPSPDYSGCGKD